MADAGLCQLDQPVRASRPIQAIIFDCDGTLVDSERVGNAALVECVAELGLQLSLDQALQHFAGRKMADTLDMIEAWLGKPLPDDFLPHLRQRMAAAFEAHLKPMDGVHDLLANLTLPFCVASNGPRQKMLVSLKVTRLLPFFQERIFSAYDCESWKPEPGLFHYAAQAMGISPEHIAVVDDNVLGIRAATAAGMMPLGYAPHDEGAVLAQAGASVFHHMGDLMDLLSSHS